MNYFQVSIYPPSDYAWVDAEKAEPYQIKALEEAPAKRVSFCNTLKDLNINVEEKYLCAVILDSNTICKLLQAGVSFSIIRQMPEGGVDGKPVSFSIGPYRSVKVSGQVIRKLFPVDLPVKLGDSAGDGDDISF